MSRNVGNKSPSTTDCSNAPRRSTLNELITLAYSLMSKGMRPSREATGRKTGYLSETISGSLNPAWVEWLMGFPPGWTDLKP